MTFTSSLHAHAGTVVLEAVGELDSSTAPEFRAAVEEAVTADTTRLVLDLRGLEYLSSAGLRVLVFARQKMGADSGLVVVGARESVVETIRLTGFQHSLTFCDDLPQ